MKVFLRWVLKITTAFIFTVMNVQAGGVHGGGSSGKPRAAAPAASVESISETANDRATKGRSLGAIYVDGYEVRVKIADARDSIPDGGSHNILVKIKLGDDIQRNATIKGDVVFPDRTKKSKSFLELGDWYLAGYNLDQHGKHHISILFTNKGDKEHRAEFAYP